MIQHRFVSTEGVDLVKKFEGLSLTPYICPGGHLSIGYGHKIKPKEVIGNIDKATAEYLLQQDLHLSERAVIRLINVQLDDHQFSALVSFTYNVGAAALQRSTLRQKINRKQYAEASLEFMRWIYISGQPSIGLARRRAEERKLYDTT